MAETNMHNFVDNLVERVAVVGASGQLGTALRRCLPQNLDIVPITRNELDVTNPHAVASSKYLSDVDAIINVTAYTDVDGAEANPGAAHLANALAPKYLAQRSAAESAFFIHVSTDYVFGDFVSEKSGSGSEPESSGAQQQDGQRMSSHDVQRRPLQIDDPTVPETIYGRTKLVGESNVRQLVAEANLRAAIVRTAWVWSGPTQPESRDFVSTMERLANNLRGRQLPDVLIDAAETPDPSRPYEGYALLDYAALPEGTVKVVNDQFGNPTFVGDLANAIWQLAQSQSAGVFHVTGTGQATWFDVAQAVFEARGVDKRWVIPCASSQFPRPAKRPQWSVLDGDSWTVAGFAPLPQWRESLRMVIESEPTV